MVISSTVVHREYGGDADFTAPFPVPLGLAHFSVTNARARVCPSIPIDCAHVPLALRMLSSLWQSAGSYDLSIAMPAECLPLTISGRFFTAIAAAVIAHRAQACGAPRACIVACPPHVSPALLAATCRHLAKHVTRMWSTAGRRYGLLGQGWGEGGGLRCSS